MQSLHRPNTIRGKDGIHAQTVVDGGVRGRKLPLEEVNRVDRLKIDLVVQVNIKHITRDVLRQRDAAQGTRIHKFGGVGNEQGLTRRQASQIGNTEILSQTASVLRNR